MAMPKRTYVWGGVGGGITNVRSVSARDISHSAWSSYPQGVVDKSREVLPYLWISRQTQ